MHRCAVYLIITFLAFGGGLASSLFAERSEYLSALQGSRLFGGKCAPTEIWKQNDERVPVNQHRNYTEMLILLKDLVTRFGKGKTHTFYISPVERKDKSESAYIYWKQDNSIITLNLPLKNPLEEETAFWLYTGKTRIDLVKDVASAEDKVDSSTFLVTKSWADKIIKDCVSNGKKLTIPKKVKKASFHKSIG